MKERMQGLVTLLKQSAEGVEAQAFVDSGAVLEKAWAQKCGVGWQGKNTLILNRESGSFHFIGIILTNLELEPDPPETDHCGTCNACMKACPAGALETPYQLDIARCISFLTIESREDIPEPLKSRIGNHLYGCDICQDVCPYNRFARPHQVPEFLPPEELMQMRKKEWNSMTESDFNRIFKNSPLKRWGYDRLQRGLSEKRPRQGG
jgi:epoxyqueuosine reductase